MANPDTEARMDPMSPETHAEQSSEETFEGQETDPQQLPSLAPYIDDLKKFKPGFFRKGIALLYGERITLCKSLKNGAEILIHGKVKPLMKNRGLYLTRVKLLEKKMIGRCSCPNGFFSSCFFQKFPPKYN